VELGHAVKIAANVPAGHPKKAKEHEANKSEKNLNQKLWEIQKPVHP
jgi:hypothetical protein